MSLLPGTCWNEAQVGTNAIGTAIVELAGNLPSFQDNVCHATINVDDLDPRVWPAVIAALLAAGASDAWLTPILMKKGRPAHTLHVLVGADAAAGVRREIFRQTSTIGVREIPVGKHALDREMRVVEVDGHRVRVKLALHQGVVVNAQPEYDDLAALAETTGRAVKDVLAEAVAASRAIADGPARAT